MRNSYTVVLERMKTFSGAFESEPYECGWATEAIFFIKVHEMSAQSRFRARIQFSADGIDWADERTVFEGIAQAGYYFARVAHFGTWLRLASAIDGASPEVKVTIQLVLKE